jgi:hypothetical protein
MQSEFLAVMGINRLVKLVDDTIFDTELHGSNGNDYGIGLSTHRFQIDHHLNHGLS